MKNTWLNWGQGHWYYWYCCGFSYSSWRKWSEFQARNHLFKERKWSESGSSLATLDNIHLQSGHWAPAWGGNAHLTSNRCNIWSCRILFYNPRSMEVEKHKVKGNQALICQPNRLCYYSVDSGGCQHWGGGIANDCPSWMLVEGNHLVRRQEQNWTLFKHPTSAPSAALSSGAQRSPFVSSSLHTPQLVRAFRYPESVWQFCCLFFRSVLPSYFSSVSRVNLERKQATALAISSSWENVFISLSQK